MSAPDAAAPAVTTREDRVDGARSQARIAGFDGLRALSVGFVIVGHVGLQEAIGGPVFAVFNAGTGVKVFFVLSGFLITSLLLRERRESGTISLSGFMARRMLRIAPAYAVALAFLAVIGASPIALAYAATYSYNVMPVATRVHFMNHFWSLSVEEHFYLVWPFAVLVLGRAARWFAVGVAVLCIVALFARVDGRVTIPAALSISLGCLAALSGLRIRSAWFVLAAVPMVAFSEATAAVGATILVVWVASNQDRVRPLEWRPLVYIGTISYGIYIWQGIFTGNGPYRAGPFPPDNMLLAVALTLVVAVASFHLLEQPIQHWGRAALRRRTRRSDR